MDAQAILVVILSIFLAVFLVLAIALSIALLRVMGKVRKVTDKAESVAQNLVGASRIVKNNIRPISLGAAALGIIGKMMGSKVKKGNKKHG